MSWIAVGTTAAGIGASYLTKDKGKGLETAADPYAQIRKPYMNWLEGQIGQPGQSYSGQMVAPLSSPEASSFDWLRQYGEGSQAQDPTFQKARSVVDKTLTDKYDPATSPYYQAVKAEASRNLADTQKNIMSQAGGTGNVWTGGRLKEQGEAATASNIGLNRVLGELALQERQNQLSVIPQALGMSQTLAQEPLAKASAFQQFGALPREIEQAMNTAKYNEWIRSQVEYPMQIASMAGGTQQAPIYREPTPGIGQQLLGGVAGGVGQALPGWISDWLKNRKTPTTP